MRKTFSITDNEALDKLDQVENQSNYIQTLILRDIYDTYGVKQYEVGMMIALKYIQMAIDTIKKGIENKK